MGVPMHLALPVHPRTGLSAVGIVNGRPVWPILGASEDHGTGGDDKKPDDQSNTDDGQKDADKKPEGGGDTTDWKAKAREWEKRAKVNSGAAAELAKVKAAAMTDQEKAVEAAKAEGRTA